MLRDLFPMGWQVAVYGPLLALEASLVLLVLLVILRKAAGLTPRRFDAPERLVDIVVSSILLVATAPLMGAIAVALRATGSSTVFTVRFPCSIRAGRWNTSFRIWKFRTMVDGEHQHRVSPFSAVSLSDSRLTPIGRFLRRTGLDDLPLLVNVLLGHMSMFGPKAVTLEEAERIQKKYPKRLNVRPGLLSRSDPARYRIRWRQHTPYVERRILATEHIWKLEDEYLRQLSPAANLRVLWRYAPVLLARCLLPVKDA